MLVSQMKPDDVHEQHEVQVYLCRLSREDAFLLEEVNEHYWVLLSMQEQAQGQAMRRTEHAQVYWFSHILLRLLLAQQLDCDAKELAFKKGEYGKPALMPIFSAQAKKMPLHFNLSHTEGVVGVALANVSVGFDVETKLVDSPVDLAKACFTQAEANCVAASDCPQRMFRQYWVMKEAVAKVTGVGLMQPMCEISQAMLTQNGWQQVVDEKYETGMSDTYRDTQIWAQRLDETEKGRHWDAAVAIAQHELNSQVLELPAVTVHWLDVHDVLQWAQMNRPLMEC